ncbi:hypothetical protein [Kitasatospora brasiliensis]|uniref:hypothetical protein n=1 Tax=Kitasatospora brasiliensis TaxID=3058040 RepID=UPI00292E4E57|nr:hypothetical protein [Kitasatospora sp. K002]
MPAPGGGHEHPTTDRPSPLRSALGDIDTALAIHRDPAARAPNPSDALAIRPEAGADHSRVRDCQRATGHGGLP